MLLAKRGKSPLHDRVGRAVPLITLARESAQTHAGSSRQIRLCLPSGRAIVSRIVKENMSPDSIHYSDTRELPIANVLALYRANEWSSAEKPELLHKALLASHSLVTAWHDATLVGLGNAISDGYLVVYYPHLLVLPEYQGQGVGTGIMRRLMARYEGFHQHILVADGGTQDFYRKLGFERAGKTEPMWVYAGHEH